MALLDSGSTMTLARPASLGLLGLYQSPVCMGILERSPQPKFASPAQLQSGPSSSDLQEACMAHGEGDVTRRDSSGETPSPSNPVLYLFFEVTEREILGVNRRRTNDCWEYLRQIKGVNRYPDQWLVWKTASSIT